jgi:endo-beta-N-acetylglucosaminidase D
MGHKLSFSLPFNFKNALAGGVTISLARDIHGKSYSNVRLAIELPDPK